MSPVVHNAAFVELGLDWVLVALEVTPGRLGAAVDGWRALGVAGASVTMPHKETVLGHLDEVTEEAAVLGAVNCVVVDGDRLVGHNTDGAGFTAAMSGSGSRAVAATAGQVVILGTGGAARAVARAVAVAGAAGVRIVSRSPERARAAADALGTGVEAGVADDVADADLVVNATPVGMPDHPGLPCPVGMLRPEAVAVDLVYHPLRTDWLTACAGRGLEVANGVPMLVHQAAIAFELWTRMTPPTEVMMRAAHRALHADARWGK